MSLPWVSRRAFSIQEEALARAYQEIDTLREQVRFLIDRQTVLENPYAAWQLRVQAQMDKEATAKAEKQLAPEADEEENIVARL